MAEESIDRAAIRAMVEDFWRSFLAVARQNPQVGAESILRFNERMQSTAALMEKEQAEVFLRTVEEERELLFNEYERNPDALKRRLGLETNVTQSTIISRQQIDPKPSTRKAFALPPNLTMKCCARWRARRALRS